MAVFIETEFPSKAPAIEGSYRFLPSKVTCDYWSGCIPFSIIDPHVLYDIVYTHNGIFSHLKNEVLGFPGGAVVGNPPANAGDTGSSPGLGGSHMPRSS